MRPLTFGEAWDMVVGMTWAWDYCKDGTSRENAPGLQEWFSRTGRGKPSLKICRAIAAEIRRQSREHLVETVERVGIGNGPGQVRFP